MNVTDSTSSIETVVMPHLSDAHAYLTPNPSRARSETKISIISIRYKTLLQAHKIGPRLSLALPCGIRLFAATPKPTLEVSADDRRA
jgi:hypothetical protein